MSTADIVNQWFRERLACAPLSRDTPAYNQAFAALPELIARLEGQSPEAAAAEDPTSAKKAPSQPAADAAPAKE